MVLVNLAMLVIGLLLLVKGADFFVTAAASIAKRLGVSEFVIGLTLVAIGTTIPELASSVAASLKQASGLVIGNIVGSNIANIGLIIGAAAALKAIPTKLEMLKRDGYVMLFSALMFIGFISDFTVTIQEAVICIVFYAAYLIFLTEQKPELKEKQHFKHFMNYFFRFGYVKALMLRFNNINQKGKKSSPHPIGRKIPGRMGRDLAILIAGAAGVIIGANYLVEGAVFFAGLLELPQTVVGITLVAIGTSLPELMVAIVAARRGYGDIAVGNVIGANIINILLIMGLSALVAPLAVTGGVLYIAAPFMLLLSVLLLVFFRTGWRIKRKEGLVFLSLYALFIAAVAMGFFVF